MQKHVKKWLTSLLLNFGGLLLALTLVYVAGVVALIQVSARSVVDNPYFRMNPLDLLAMVMGVIAIGFVFRFTGKLYTLLTQWLKSR